jgi:hypothetical protein
MPDLQDMIGFSDYHACNLNNLPLVAGLGGLLPRFRTIVPLGRAESRIRASRVEVERLFVQM